MSPQNQAIQALNMLAAEAGIPPLPYSDTDEAELAGINPVIFKSLKRYVQDHTPVGDFLTAVLSNNLREAVFRADDENLASLPAIVRWLHWEAPGRCWGSATNVLAWLAEAKR